MKRISAFLLAIVMLFAMSACNTDSQNNTSNGTSESTGASANTAIEVPENFMLIKGGSFEMCSPNTEAWRSDDETQHTVAVSDFYMSVYELTQAEYREITGENPGSFSGDELSVENISWLGAIRYCNALSQKENLTPVRTADGQNIT